MIAPDDIRKAKRIMSKGATLAFAASVVDADDSDLDLALWNALGEPNVVSRRPPRSAEARQRSAETLLARWSDPAFADARRAASRAKFRTVNKLARMGLQDAEIAQAVHLIRVKRIRLAEAAQIVLRSRRAA